MLVNRENIQKYLDLFLDSKINFFDDINEKSKKATKIVNVIRKINLISPRFSLLTIYKSFVKPYLGYGKVIFDQLISSRLSNKLRIAHYNDVLAISVSISKTIK